MKRLLIRLVVSLAIGAGFLYLASQKIDFQGAWDTIAAAKWTVLIPYVACMALQHFFRVWRWGQLLGPIHPVPFSKLLPVSSVGFLAIVALPLRMGEFVRPYLIAEPPQLRMSQALGTMAVERVFDGLTLSLTAAAAVLIAKSRGTDVPAWVLSAGLVALGLFGVALVVLVMTLWQRERAVTLCHRIFCLVSKKIADKAAGVARGIVEGFQVLPDFRRLSIFVFATCSYWFLNAFALWIIGLGFDLPLTVPQSMGLIALVGIGIMIPAGPGFVGNFELFAEGALALYLPKQVLAKTGAGFILAAHTTNAGWYLITGALALLSSHVSFSRVMNATEPKPDAEPEPDAEPSNG
jgi:uncharacterized protein (TIRG00374 family)